MANLLIVYGALNYPLRATTRDHIDCFRRYSEHRCFYLNLHGLGRQPYRKVPWYVQQVKFDLIIFHTDLIGLQWFPNGGLKYFTEQAHAVKKMGGIKVALNQDEYYNTVALEQFINEFDIDYVFSLASPSEWQKIYPTVDFQKVKFFRSLPGYLDEKTLSRIERLASNSPIRTIDIGYRAYGIRQWLGRHGFLKIQIAHIFQDKAYQYGLITDISTRLEDTFYGDDWYRFLLRCKYTIAVEGGATVLDRNGSIGPSTRAYLAEHPQANFEEVEAACFPGQDGYYRYMAISPKHLEACATKTCQVLVEGEYNGILTAGKHYIELKRDFSNIAQVLECVQQDDLRAGMVERVYQDVVESGLYTYRNFVKFVLDSTLGQPIDQPQSIRSKGREWFFYLLGRIDDKLYYWVIVAVRSYLRKFIKSVLPPFFIRTFRKSRRG